MEQNVDLGKLIEKSNRSNFQRLKENGHGVEFSNKFSEQLTRLIVLSSADIPEVASEVQVEREGSFGILPAPARKDFLKAMLKGERTPPLKVHEEAIRVGQPERMLDRISLHTIVEINPSTASSQAGQMVIADSLFSVLQTVSIENPAFQGKDQFGATISIKAKELRGILHVIKKSVLGNFEYEELPINQPEDVQKALTTIEQGLSWVLQFHPKDTPKYETLAYETLDAQIEKRVDQDKGERQISLPILVAPNSPQFIPTSSPILLIQSGNDYPMTILNNS